MFFFGSLVSWYFIFLFRKSLKYKHQNFMHISPHVNNKIVNILRWAHFLSKETHRHLMKTHLRLETWKQKKKRKQRRGKKRDSISNSMEINSSSLMRNNLVNHINTQLLWSSAKIGAHAKSLQKSMTLVITRRGAEQLWNFLKHNMAYLCVSTAQPHTYSNHSTVITVKSYSTFPCRILYFFMCFSVCLHIYKIVESV